MRNFAVGNVPADGLAPLGARTSADTKFGADTKFVFVYTGSSGARRTNIDLKSNIRTQQIPADFLNINLTRCTISRAYG